MIKTPPTSHEIQDELVREITRVWLEQMLKHKDHAPAIRMFQIDGG